MSPDQLGSRNLTSLVFLHGVQDRPDELLTSTMVSIVKELGESTNIKAGRQGSLTIQDQTTPFDPFYTFG